MKHARKNEFGIRKLSVGVCSVVIGMSFLAANQVLAEETPAPLVGDESVATPVPAPDASQTAVARLKEQLFELATLLDNMNNENANQLLTSLLPAVEEALKEKDVAKLDQISTQIESIKARLQQTTSSTGSSPVSTPAATEKKEEEGGEEEVSTPAAPAETPAPSTDTAPTQPAPGEAISPAAPDAEEEEGEEADQPSAERELPSIDYSKLPENVTGWELRDHEVKRVDNETLTNANGAKISFDETIKEHIKTATSGTIYVEYKVPTNAPFHTVFNVTSGSKDNNYTAVYINSGTLAIETRTDQGYRHLNNGTERVKNGEWNSIALTFDKNPETNKTTLKLYANGILSLTQEDDKDLFSKIPDIEHVQVGAAQRVNGSKWGVNGMVVRNATIYNRALTPEEVQKRSALFVREAYTPPVREGESVTDRAPVFEGGRGGQKNAQGVHAYRIPALLKTVDGTLIAAIDERNTTSGDWGNIATVIKRSTDNGASWSDTIKLVDLRNSQSGPGHLDPFTIDPALVQDPTTKRIFALYDMMPDHGSANGGGGAFGLGERHIESYSTVGDKKYLNIYKDNQKYTVRENGVVYNPEGQATDYRVNVNDSSTHFANLGDLYKGESLVGNIYFQHDNGEHAFKVANTMYIWMSYSDNNGETWSRPTDLTANFIQPHMKFLGLGPGAGIALHTGDKKGRLVVPGYVANYTSFLSGSQSAFVFYSDDHGATWKMGKTFNDDRTLADGTVLHSRDMNNSGEQGTEATVVQLNNGDLKMFMRGLKGKVRVATSKNGGESWENAVDIMDDVPDVYVQLSAVHLNRGGKEYVVLANASGPGRTNGHVRLAEVQPDGSLKWINHRQIEEGKFAYNSLQYLGDDEFGLLYENSTGNQNDYTAYYKKFNWTFLTLPEPKLPENPLVTTHVDENNYAILQFDKPILPTAKPGLLLSNGRTIEFVTQVDEKTVVYRVTDEDKNAAIIDVASGDLSNINGYKTVLGKFLSPTDTRMLSKLDNKILKVTATDIWQGGHGPEKLVDGDKQTIAELIWDTPSNREMGRVVSLPQTIAFTQKSNDPFNLHTMLITKRTNNNGTMTKYQVKAYLGDKEVYASEVVEVPFAQEEVLHSFGNGVRADRVELIPMEARTNATTIANQMLTLKEVALYAVDTLTETRREEVVETIPFDTERRNDDSLAKGTEVVAVEGVNGSVTKEYDLVVTNGVVADRKLVGEKEGSRVDPVTKVIRIGTKVEEVKPTPPAPEVSPGASQPAVPSQPEVKKEAGAFAKPVFVEDEELHFQNGKGVTAEDAPVFEGTIEPMSHKGVKPLPEIKPLPEMKPVDETKPVAQLSMSANPKVEPMAQQAKKSEQTLPATGSKETGFFLAMGLVGLLATVRARKENH